MLLKVRLALHPECLDRVLAEPALVSKLRVGVASGVVEESLSVLAVPTVAVDRCSSHLLVSARSQHQ